MKKVIAIVLAFVLSFGLFACGSAEPSGTSTPTETALVLTPESLAGTYESILWCFHDSFTLNSNGTYDYTDTATHTENTNNDASLHAAKGTFKISDNRITLDEKYSEAVSSELPNLVVNDCFYDIKWRVFEEDVDYGMKFTPDANGMTDQKFESWVLNADIPGCDHNYISLDLNNDGSFVMEMGLRLSTIRVRESYTGTYRYADSTLTLTYENKDYPLHVTEDGQIYFVGYKKA